MTDNEIIKALGYCVSHDECGADCPCFSGKLEMCGDREGLLKQCLDLINRQKAEVERLKEELDGETVKNMRLGHEIEQWEEEANRYQNLWCEAVKDIQTAKSEAIKEITDGLVTMLLNINESLNCEDIVENIKRFSSRLTEGREDV